MSGESLDGKVIRLPQVQQGEDFEATKDLTHFDKARQELELATRIDEVKSIRDKAAAIQAYLKQSGESLEIQNMAAEIKIRAERRAGEILSEMDLHKGGRPSENRSHDEMGFPRLKDLDIDRNMSSRCQLIASIPEKDFDERVAEIKGKGQELTSKEFLSLAGYLQRERERQERREVALQEAAQVASDERIKVLCGDFREILTEEMVPNGSVSLVLTDLPYEQEYLGLWDSLGQLSQRVLRDGGILAAYSGCIHLPEVLSILSRHLTYCWTAALLNEAFADTIFHPIRVKSLWKPIILFTKGRTEPFAHEDPSLRYLKDVIHGDGLGNLNKDAHPWQQGVGESGYMIEVLSLPGEIVVDPCCGSGTVAVAAKRLNRRFVGCDESIDAVNTALARLAQELE